MTWGWARRSELSRPAPRGRGAARPADGFSMSAAAQPGLAPCVKDAARSATAGLGVRPRGPSAPRRRRACRRRSGDSKVRPTWRAISRRSPTPNPQGHSPQAEGRFPSCDRVVTTSPASSRASLERYRRPASRSELQFEDSHRRLPSPASWRAAGAGDLRRLYWRGRLIASTCRSRRPTLLDKFFLHGELAGPRRLNLYS